MSFDPLSQNCHEFRPLAFVVLTLVIPDHGEHDVLSRINDEQRTATATVTIAAESEALRLVLKSDPVSHVQRGKVRFQ